MKKFYSLCFSVAVFAATVNSYSQNDCGNGRYLNKIFTNYALTSNIAYGQNFKVNGQSQTLLLDVYQPQGDDSTVLRPLIIWIHGGTFVGGSKTGTDVAPLSQDFAKMGFVATSIEYRVGMQDYPLPGPDSVDATESVVRAVHDARAAVRFFKKNFTEGGNTYKIDTNLIFVAGVSAGAITAVHLAYLDDINEYPAYIDTTKVGLGGGIEGNSGNPGYSSKARAIVNSAGAIRDTSWMKSNDTPIISLHGTADGTVPYGTAMIYVGGFYPIMVVSGSGSIHQRTDNLGINNCLKPFYGADHVPHVGNAQYTDTLEKYTGNYLYQFICNAAPECGYYTVGISENKTESGIVVYPNPNNGNFNLIISQFDNLKMRKLKIYNVLGKMVYSQQLTTSNEQLTTNLSDGIYFYQIIVGEKIYTGKLVKE